jgi:GntR family transcriptional regulator, vanillate catabolism transcriptional regulator
MASQIHLVVNELRRRIVAGELVPGTRLVELALAAQLGVSRTPIRLAFEELEKQGLLERLSTRGFRVRQLTVDDISDAIDVRGVLEGMAVRLAAERSPGAETLAELQRCVAEGQDLIREAAHNQDTVDLARWIPMNARFHACLMAAAANKALASALTHVDKLPLASASALSLGGAAPALELAFLQRAQQDHEDIVDALQAHEGARAEALMREHARRSRDNKRELLTGSRLHRIA